MSVSLSSIKNKDQRAEAIRRRINSGTMGLGYWAAVDAIKTRKKVLKVEERLGSYPESILLLGQLIQDYFAHYDDEFDDEL